MGTPPRQRAAPLGLLGAVVAVMDLVVCAPRLGADVVHLKSGQSIEGEVSIDDRTGVVSVRKSSGVILRFAGDRVERISRKKSAAEELRENLEKIREGDEDEIESLVKLAVFARDKKLRDDLQRICRRILTIDPNHDLARRELGYVVFENIWILESELARNHREKGLIKFRGEWMTEAEKDRRQRQELREKIANLLDSLATDNRYVQEFAVRELMALRDPLGREIFSSYIEDPRELVRIVAVSVLANYASETDRPEDDPEARRITAKLFQRLMDADRSAKEQQALTMSLRLFQPQESFRLALRRLQESRADWERRRSGEVVRMTLRKAWVPALCRGLVTAGGGGKRTHEGVRVTLREIFGVDHGYDVDAWLRWWRANEARFRDEP